MLTALVYMLNRGTTNKYLLGHNLRVPTYIYIYICVCVCMCVCVSVTAFYLNTNGPILMKLEPHDLNKILR